MGLQDAMNYVLFANPVSSTAGYYAKSVASTAYQYSGFAPKVEQKMVAPEVLWRVAARTGPWVRLAALSGCTAVIIGAYGAHSINFPPDEKGMERKEIFARTNTYHFIHALAMMGLPMCRVPVLAASFMVSGTLMFCGTCYYTAITGKKDYKKITPIGGTCLILGWLAMCI